MAQRRIRLIDAGFDPRNPPVLPEKDGLFRPLISDEGEFAVAVKRIFSGNSLLITDEAVLHLFAQELLERMREPSTADKEIWVLPFWPGCLFDAAGLKVHGSREIQALYPACARTFYVPQGEAVLKRESSRVLGHLRFDPGAYVRAAAQAAEREGWTVLKEGS
jgi:hypothetical protein